MSACNHEILHQTSDCVLRWTWERQEDGTYEPEETHDKVLWEETLEFKCIQCNELVDLDDDARIEDDNEEGT